MENSLAPDIDHINRAVRAVLGPDRVREVGCVYKQNIDGAPIIWVRVIYDANEGITVDEMRRVSDALWPVGASEDLAVPVIDFVADTDLVPTAAE
ncbi:MAG: hypothetical protein CMN17_07110 [Roseovarius sp.]|jgi:hypothetical protein|nr:hypothetical protein [Roseovarius sp.]MBK45893.1 hypothetical protein [Roseovarius sp.]